MMEKVTLGKTNIEVTKIGFGVLTVGRTQLNLPINKGADVLRYALDMGINFLDTAQYYETYPYIRRALKGTHHSPVISSKSLCHSYKSMVNAVEEARNELDRDVIDIFLLHEVRSSEDFSLRKGAWEALLDMKSKGIISAVGLSTHHTDVAMMAATNEECDVIFPLINFQSLGVRTGNAQGTKEDMAAAIKKACQNGKGVFSMKAFGGGNLISQYVKALDYVYSIDGISSVMMGFGNTYEVDAAIAYISGTLSKDYTSDTSKKKIHIDRGDCEGCGACVKRCPNGAIFVNKDDGLSDIDYSKCLTCGYCAPVCPVRAIIMIDK